jgi:hypothetical protein
MKVQMKVTDNIIVVAEGENQAEVFEELAGLQEIFGEAKCGKCGCTELRYICRNVEGDMFHELRCTKCWATLTFGLKKKPNGVLFPHRKENENKSIMGLEPGTKLPDNGWLKFDKEKKVRY